MTPDTAREGVDRPQRYAPPDAGAVEWVDVGGMETRETKEMQLVMEVER